VAPRSERKKKRQEPLPGPRHEVTELILKPKTEKEERGKGGTTCKKGGRRGIG